VRHTTVSMANPPNRIEVVTSLQRRRRWTASQKVRMVEETFAQLRRFRTGRPAQIHVAWFPAISLPPKRRYRVPALGDCQHAHDPWRSTDHLEAAADLAYDRWNSFSRITVSQNQTGPPSMFGASPRMPDSTIEQRALNIDGGAGTALYRFNGNQITV
jgi:hypothetical protein